MLFPGKKLLGQWNTFISDQHEKSLTRILQGYKNKEKKKRYSESTIAVTLAEHLLRVLAPTRSYAVHKKSEKCECGYTACKATPPKYGNTGIGMSPFFKKLYGFIFSFNWILKGAQSTDIKNIVSLLAIISCDL